MRFQGETAIFESGTRVHANCQLVSVRQSGNGWGLADGYDGDFEEDKLSIDDKIELADYMIRLWSTFLGDMLRVKNRGE